MKSRKQQVSRSAIELIKRFEGYRKTAARLEDGRWTIGYGHIKTARQGAEVSEADAEALLIYDLMEVAGVIDECVYTPLTQNQFDALAAFVFNIGTENFRRAGVLRRLNEGALLQAACAMEMWRRADFQGERIVVDALVRRRAAEKALFLTPPGGFVPAPSPVVRPKVDNDTTGAVPAEKPVEVQASLDGENAVAERIGELPPLHPSPAPDQDEPSATEAAAEAVTARLSSILERSDEELPTYEPRPEPPAPPETGLELDMPSPPEPPAEPAEPEPAQTAAPEPGFSLTPPPSFEAEPQVQEQPVRAIAAEHRGPQLFSAEPMTFDDFDARSAPVETFDATGHFDDAEVEPVRGFGPGPLVIGLGVLGLIVFAGGLFWAINTKDPNGGLFSGPAMAGMAFALAGIVGVSIAFYFFLSRLGGREEQQ